MTRTVLFAFVIVLLTSCGNQKESLRLNLEEGKTYHQIMENTATIAQQWQGASMEMVMSVSGSISYRVIESTADYYDLEIRYDRLIMEIKMPSGSVTFNSENPDSVDVFSRTLSALTKYSFGAQIKPNGKVIKVEGVDRLLDQLIGQLQDISERQGNQIKSQLSQAYGDEAFKGNFETCLAIFPEKPVAVGDTWQIKTRIESGMSAEIITLYTLESMDGNECHITGSSTLKTDNLDASIESNGMPMRYDVTGTMSSDILLSASTGWIKEATILQQIGGTAFIEDNAKMPGGMEIPMNMKNDLRIWSEE